MARFYVSMTWEDWPQGGSWAEVIEADGPEQAEVIARDRMADAEPHSDEAGYRDDWECVDCFDLDEFIRQHALWKIDQAGAMLRALKTIANTPDISPGRARQIASLAVHEAITDKPAPQFEPGTPVEPSGSSTH